MYSARSPIQAWLRTPLGRSLRALESALVADALTGVFGVQLLQIGLWGEADQFLRSGRTLRTALLDQRAASGVTALSEAGRLAIATSSIDAVLLPHTLELDPDPHQVLREVDRILVGEGQVVVLGFNPAGLWGLRRVLARGGFPPGIQHFIRERRMRDWLALLGFEMLGVRGYLYGGPFNKPAMLSTSKVMESTGERFWPRLPGAYLLRARKRVFAITPLRPRWQPEGRVVGGLVEPTTRNTA